MTLHRMQSSQRHGEGPIRFAPRAGKETWLRGIGFAGILLLALGIVGPALAECPVAEITTPPLHATVREPRMAIEWQPIDAVDRYRLQLESRTPEGQVIEHFDTAVSGTRFVPPRPLASGRAVVKLSVSEDCKAGSTPLSEQRARFVVDLPAVCAAPASLTVSRDAARLDWAPVAGAERYGVEFFAAGDGRLLSRRETASAAAILPPVGAPRIVSVRAHCGASPGTAIYGFIAASR